MTIEGRATAEGTAAYRDRFTGKLSPEHFRFIDDLVVGTIGIGTYLGPHNEETDADYRGALVEALKTGCNHLDTAINYRCMRSEKIIGRTLEILSDEGRIARNEVILCTKGGYVPFDGEAPKNIRRFIRESYVEPGIVEEDDLVGGCHAMTPRFLETQITRSLENLRARTIDIYYLHNPEVHRAVLPRGAFLDRMKRAFAFLEEEAAVGRIARYGVSSWEAFRAEPSSPVHISLEDLVKIARKVAGENHHFAAVQLPFNIAMMEGFALAGQEVEGMPLSAVDAAARLGVAMTFSAPFLQGRLLRQFPDLLARGLKDIDSNAKKAIQFARSIPGVASVLVGMSKDVHVAENLSLARKPPLSMDELAVLFE
ncbi:MAG: aldo/keto reductase [Candidatus Eisenbacteria bacterium]